MSSIAQISWIELLDPSVSVDTRGNLLYRNVLKKHGYWAWKRVGDLLPIDYIPELAKTFKPNYTPAIDSLENMLQSRSYEEITGNLIHDALDGLSFKDSDHEKIINKLRTDISDIIDETEREKWQQLKTNKEKADYLRQFWLIRDMTYGDKINERLNEHYNRLKAARKFYNSFAPTGYDDRGKIFIKYGPPDNRSVDINPTGGKSTESWVYETGQKQIIFDFVDKGSGYDLSYRIDESIVFSNPIVRFAAIGDILSKRTDISFKYAIAYNKFLNLSQGENINYVEVLRLIEYDLKKLTQEQYENQANLPVSTSNIFEGVSFLDFNLQSAIFRNSATEHELALAYGFKKNKIKRFKKDNSSNISIRTVIRNPALVDISSREDNLSVEEQDFDEHNEFITTIQIPNEINRYYVLIDVNNPEKKQRGIKDISVKVPSFSDDEFQLSSVIFAKNIKPIAATSSSQNLKLTSSLVRNDLEIEMYPFSTLKRINPIFVYFEIYHLEKGLDGKTQYQVEYTVQPKKKKGILARVTSLNPFKQDKGSISVTDVRDGNDINPNFWVQLDLGQLKQGDYDLIVNVKDINTNMAKEGKLEFHLE
jgi:GWxTD domain-containing protein